MHTANVDECTDCNLHLICHPRGTGNGAAAAAVKINQGQLARGEALYVAGQDCAAVFALRSGCVKDVLTRRDGTESVVGFCLPGELAGLGSLPAERARTTAIAVSPTRYCRLSWLAFRRLVVTTPEIGEELVRLMSSSLSSARETLVSVLEQDALARVAALLIDLSERLQRTGRDGAQFRLSLARSDIASYLGLTVETVSRAFTELRERSVVAVRGKELKFLNPPELRRLAGRP